MSERVRLPTKSRRRNAAIVSTALACTVVSGCADATPIDRCYTYPIGIDSRSSSVTQATLYVLREYFGATSDTLSDGTFENLSTMAGKISGELDDQRKNRGEPVQPTDIVGLRLAFKAGLPDPSDGAVLHAEPALTDAINQINPDGQKSVNQIDCQTGRLIEVLTPNIK